MNLRYYQADAIRAVLDCLQHQPGVNPCVEIPTGGGKTPIIATLASVIAKAGARVLIVAHRKELLEQTAEKLQMWGDGVPFSIVSAGLGQKDYTGRIVIAGVQSVYKHADELAKTQPINFIIVDEAHLIPDTDASASGMYQTLIASLRGYFPGLRVIGLTATPYRLGTGTVVGQDKILNEIVYRVGVRELIEKGYLSKLRSRLPALDVDNDALRVERGEFKTADLDAAYGQSAIVHTACVNLVNMTKQRHSVLVFACSVAHAKLLADELKKLQPDGVELVTGSTPSDVRADVLRRFKDADASADLLGQAHRVKYLVNVDVLTTGFDATNVDCVALLRPTMSPGLYYQMVGRGFRLHENKADCLILDFAGNVERHGPVDELQGVKEKKKGTGMAPIKKCPSCLSVIPAQSKTCPECGAAIINQDYDCPACHELVDNRAYFCMYCGHQLREPKHDALAQTSFNVISTESVPEICEDVAAVSYQVHTSRKSGKETLRVDYQTTLGNRLTEYICFNHEGFAHHKALKWWAARSNIAPAPCSVQQAFYLADGGYIGTPTRIKYRPKHGDKYAEITGADVVCKEIGTQPYPRTDNPLAISCQLCGASSFLYVETQHNVYQIRCAKCGEIFGEFSPDNCDGVEGLRGELDSMRRAGVAFYSAAGKVDDVLNQTADDFFKDDGAASLNDFKDVFGGNIEDDIPF